VPPALDNAVSRRSRGLNVFACEKLPAGNPGARFLKQATVPELGRALFPGGANKRKTPREAPRFILDQTLTGAVEPINNGSKRRRAGVSPCGLTFLASLPSITCRVRSTSEGYVRVEPRFDISLVRFGEHDGPALPRRARSFASSSSTLVWTTTTSSSMTAPA